MAFAETQNLGVKLTLEGNFNSQLAKTRAGLRGFSGDVHRATAGAGKMASGFARAGAIAAGVAVTGFGAAAKAAIDFEDAYAGVRKTVDETDLKAAGLSFESLARSFRDMATEIPIAAVDFARLGETAGALGVKAGSIEEFVRVTALMGVTTNLSADEAADAFGRIGTILGLTGKQYTELGDIIVNLGNKGASTESEIVEITKRFAAQGKAAGLLLPQIAGLASATASLGFEPERGGTALARVFANMSTNIALANKQGNVFSKITGKSIKQLQADLNKGKGLPIFLDFLKGIKDLNATDAAKVLKAAGITNTSDRTIFMAMADQLPFINEQLDTAANSTGALSTEANKKFDTIKAKLQLLRNGFMEAAITVGEGFTPALGRAAEKLSKFLKDPANKNALTNIGKDIGRSIDAIDWNEVLKGARALVDVMRSALDYAKKLYDVFNALPTEVKGALAGLAILNKGSGGLIFDGLTDILGGAGSALARSFLANLPGIGKAFVQPVFVTNMGAGGLPGGPGSVPPPPGVPGGITLPTIGAGIAIEKFDANEFQRRLAEKLGRPSAAWRAFMTGTEHNAGKSKDDKNVGLTSAAIAAIFRRAKAAGKNPTEEQVLATLKANQARQATAAAAAKAKQQETTQRVKDVDSSVDLGAARTAGASRDAGAHVAAAIAANRPKINVTTNVYVTPAGVAKATTKQESYGPGNGSNGGNLGIGGPR